MSDLNVLIMNYLVHQGYPSAAVSFAREANLSLSKEGVESITARMEVRNKIHAGDIEGAIHDINALDPLVSHPGPFCFYSPAILLRPHSHHLSSPVPLAAPYSQSLSTFAYFSYWTTTPHYISHYSDSNSSSSSAQRPHKG